MKDFKIPIMEPLGVTPKEQVELTYKAVEFRLRHDTEPLGVYWRAITPSGDVFSVVNVGLLFSSHPMESMRQHFSYWEAMPLNGGGVLGEQVYRAKDAGSLAKMIA